jgi:hypothetical protein
MEKLFTFDCIRYSCTVDKKKLPTILNTRKFKSLFADKISRGKAKGVAAIHYLSWFSGRPRPNITNVFKEINCHIGKQIYPLTYIEIACDTVFFSETEAIRAFLDIFILVFLAYGTGEYSLFHKQNLSEGFFDGRAIHIGQRSTFQLCIYTRRCKNTDRPVLRMEWRLTGNRLIRKKLRIPHETYIPNPKRCYMQLERKYFRCGTINENRLKSLMKLRSEPIEFDNILEFQKFYRNEKKTAQKECARYRKALKRPFTHYIDPIDE